MSSDGRSSRAEAKRQRRVLEVEAVAARLFSEQGFHGTSIADVIDAAGISRGTFYLYYDSKEALFLSLLDRFIARLTEVVHVVDPNGPDPTRQIEANLQRVVGVVFDHPALTRLVFQQVIGVNEPIDDKLVQLYGFLQEMVEGALRNGARAGLSRPVNERLVATALIGGMKEVFHRLLVADPSPPFDREDVARELLEFGFHGLSLKPLRR